MSSDSCPSVIRPEWDEVDRGDRVFRSIGAVFAFMVVHYERRVARPVDDLEQRLLGGPE
jgi:hypothetical protein